VIRRAGRRAAVYSRPARDPRAVRRGRIEAPIRTTLVWEGRIVSRRLALFAGLLLVASPLLAADTYVDYDRQFDFSTIHTYAWKFDPNATLQDGNPYMHDRIVDIVDARLHHGGLKRVESDPDVYVGYRVSTTSDLARESAYLGYSYPIGWYWDPYWNSVWSTPNMPWSGRTYTHGTLLIEVWTAKTNQMIWRGSGTAGVNDNFDKTSKKVLKLTGEMADRWREMREKEAKEAAKAKAGSQ
jgi:hypothetical protein